ncbi:MAG: hypothetical protein ABI383_11205 [Acidobacteriaceae bacterium]
MRRLGRLFVVFFLGVAGLAQTPVLKRSGQPRDIPNLTIGGFAIDTKAAENGVLVQANFFWYHAPFDGSKPMLFDAQKTGVDLQPMDMAYDGHGGYLMVGAVQNFSGKTVTAYLATFDRLGNEISLRRIERRDSQDVTFWPRKVAAFGNGLLVISGTTTSANATGDKLDTAIYNKEGQLVKTLELKNDVVPDIHMPPGDDGTAVLARDYSLMDETSRAKYKSNEVLSAEIAAVTSFVDRTADGEVLIVRKGAYVLSPIAFLIKPSGEVRSFRVPSLRAAESVSCRFADGRLLTLYDRTVDASQPPEGVMLVVDTNGNTVEKYQYSAPGVGMGW